VTPRRFNAENSGAGGDGFPYSEEKYYKNKLSFPHCCAKVELYSRFVLGQPIKWISSGFEQHFGWIRGGAGGESDRRVGLNRMSKMTPDINPKLNSNPKPRTDLVVWAK